MRYLYKGVYEKGRNVSVELFEDNLEKAYMTCIRNFGTRDFKMIYKVKRRN